MELLKHSGFSEIDGLSNFWSRSCPFQLHYQHTPHETTPYDTIMF